MSQKSSLPQVIQFVSEALMPDFSAITSSEPVQNEEDDRATISQKSSLPQVIRFVSEALMPDTI
jgi:hypothetical protein